MVSIREAHPKDVSDIIDLFEQTIRTINQKDYSSEQIAVWANAKNKSVWTEKVQSQHFYLAVLEDQVVGFTSIDNEGYLDFMYVHKDFQGRGIAKALLDQIERKAKELQLVKIYSSVSITAQPFFRSRGFVEYDKEHKLLNGVSFTNALMHKIL